MGGQLRRGLVVLALCVVAGREARATAGNVVLELEHASRSPVAVALGDSLRIYTRDIGWSVVRETGAPASLTPDELADMAARGRAHGARLVVWLDEKGDSCALVTLDTATLDLWRTPAGDTDPDGAARSLALRLRALLLPGAQRPGAASPLAPHAVEPRGEPPAFVTAASPVPEHPTPAPPPPAPTPAPPPVESAVHAVAPAPAPSRAWVEAGVEYGLTSSSETAWLRHGLLLHAAVPWRFLAFGADVTLNSRVDAVVGGRDESLSDIPVGVSATARWRRGHLVVEAGPRASLHFVDASARAADGRSNGPQSRLAAGVGVVAAARWTVSQHLAATVRAAGEALLPDNLYTVDGGGGPDPGAWTLSVAAGVLFVAP